MQNRIVLVSDDSDFFEYILSRLKLRKSDEIFRYGFDSVYSKIQLFKAAAVIINSEGNNLKTIELLKLLKEAAVIIFAYNINSDFVQEASMAGALNFITPFCDEKEFDAKITGALRVASLMSKNQQYRDILVKNNVLKSGNEIFLDYENILDKELESIKAEALNAVLVAISPNEKTKFLITPEQIEINIINNIRKNDILMSFAPSKYFLLLHNTNIENAEKIWAKIKVALPEKIYAGFANVAYKTRQQLVNEVLNKLHEAINCDVSERNSAEISVTGDNFKLFRQEFKKKIEKIVIPAFYHIQQKYDGKLFNITIEQTNGEDCNELILRSRHVYASFMVTSPGFSKINIDINYRGAKNAIPPKRLSLDPHELETGFLEDLLEQFILEFRKEINDDNS